MGAESIVAGALAQQSSQLAETAVGGLGTLLGGLDSLINPKVEIPPMIGMNSSDFMRLGLATIMASTNTNLAFAKQQATESKLINADANDDLMAEIAEAEALRQRCALKFGALAEANKTNTLTVAPTRDEVTDFYKSFKKILAVQNTQSTQLKLYKEHLANQYQSNFDFKGLLRKIIKGAGKIFGYVDKAKTIYEKAKPYLEKI